MRLTLLEIVQDIMNSMDGDSVNSINDTIESQQVAQIVKSTYLEMMVNRNWPHLHTAFNCESLADENYPSSLTLPENIKELKWIKYNKRKSTDTKDKYETLKYIQPEEFFDYCAARESSATNIQIISLSGMKLNIRNDQSPQYWTTFDDSQIICDSFDSEVDDVLQTSKNSCWGVKEPTWSPLDEAIPDLPSEAFPSLVEEAKSTAFYELRQAANEKAEQKAKRQERWLSRKAWRTHGGVKYPNYGRRKAFTGGQKNPLFEKN